MFKLKEVTAVFLGVLVGASGAMASTTFFDDFSGAPTTCQVDTDSWGDWDVAFAGYGCVKKEEDTGATERYQVFLDTTPQAATTSSVTHAALVLGPSFDSSTGAWVEADVNTVEQIRTGSAPNTWETGWLVFNYEDNEHFYYLTLKTNGWELGKRDPDYTGGQRFLATGNSPSLSEDEWHKLEVHTDYSGSPAEFCIEAYIDDVQIDLSTTTAMYFCDDEDPYTEGRIGLYTEDASVHWTNVDAGQN